MAVATAVPSSVRRSDWRCVWRSISSGEPSRTASGEMSNSSSTEVPASKVMVDGCCQLDGCQPSVSRICSLSPCNELCNQTCRPDWKRKVRKSAIYSLRECFYWLGDISGMRKSWELYPVGNGNPYSQTLANLQLQHVVGSRSASTLCRRDELCYDGIRPAGKRNSRIQPGQFTRTACDGFHLSHW